MGNEVKIKLTDAQKAKIKEATGKDMPEIRVESSAAIPPSERSPLQRSVPAPAPGAPRSVRARRLALGFLPAPGSCAERPACLGASRASAPRASAPRASAPRASAPRASAPRASARRARSRAPARACLRAACVGSACQRASRFGAAPRRAPRAERAPRLGSARFGAGASSRGACSPARTCNRFRVARVASPAKAGFSLCSPTRRSSAPRRTKRTRNATRGSGSVE